MADITNVAMLWTGGKDSALALLEAERSGYHVSCLVTFVPREPNFLAHPLACIKMQSQALGLPHYLLPVDTPFAKSYESGLSWLRKEMDISCVVTGDIAEVNGYSNWICERSRPVGIDAHLPLWGRDRKTLLHEFLDNGFKARISCINMHWLDEGWVGRELDRPAIAELIAIRAQNDVDLCGEEGAYHTLVMDGPLFKKQINIQSYSKCTADSMAYMKIKNMVLVNHIAA